MSRGPQHDKTCFACEHPKAGTGLRVAEARLLRLRVQSGLHAERGLGTAGVHPHSPQIVAAAATMAAAAAVGFLSNGNKSGAWPM